ncbi:beta-L-arabinofuranosidase domain-containing protein [Rhizosphaericola mali]|uniref:DUF1080 domain-containing protein n=1 Tax=Rhizosphaericola mali TaxID=2545455 RepID=A0A5P2FZY3_9BACT|nr:beta-L-arabinofuranosidase domain-containing protein [Rhizosphaericola mali]QES88795.1 DUF1080 domain-containing protein [Rhizosphaericola mali]
MKISASIILIFSSLFVFNNVDSQSNPGNYIFNRKPLKQDVYVQLPLGSIKAKGWLLNQLELQKEGFTGHAEELYSGDNELGSNSDWLGGSGNGWEKVAYYVKGLVSLAYILNDEDLKLKSQKWIEYTLLHQQDNGLFGPPKMNDWWPRMPFMYALQTYYEATNDHRVIPCLIKYFKYQLANLNAQPLDSWGKSRAGDNIELVLWVYNKTGDSFLLELANKLRMQAYQWQDIFTGNTFHYYGDDYQPRHMVNVAQALKYPAVCAEFSTDSIYKTAMQKGMAHIFDENGQPEGLGAGTEHMSGHNSIEGVETCTVVEWMQSLETASRVFHDGSIGDFLEKVAFNALPAQFSRDLKEHSYYALPNEIRAAEGLHGFNQDYNNGLLLSPYSGYPCCRFNMHMGWPYFIKNSVMATPDNGIAINTYGPMEVNAIVGNNNKLQVEEETNYPFEEMINLHLKLNHSEKFPIRLRIPNWCNSPQIWVNGKLLNHIKKGTIAELNRSWKNGDKISLKFPMHISIKKEVNNAVSVERGPIVYALKIGQNITHLKEHKVPGFYDTQIIPSTPWNYGLLLNTDDVNNQFEVVKTRMTNDPYIMNRTPIQLRVKAKKIPSWTADYRGTSAFDVPLSPIASNEKTEEITLIPFGSENIRISIFPTIGESRWISTDLKEVFKDNKSNGWVVYGGNWFYKDNAINCGSIDVNNSGAGPKIIATGTKFSDFNYSANITIKMNGNAGLVFRVNKPAIGTDAYNGYYVGLDAEEGQVVFGKASGGKWEVIKSAPKDIKLNENYQIKVNAKGDAFEIFVNGNSIITANDATYINGNIGLRAFKALAKMDNIYVQAL